MNLLLLLDMAAAAGSDGAAVEADGEQLSAEELLASAWAGAAAVSGAGSVAYVGTNGLGFPIALFAAAAAGVPFAPLNYRLGVDQLDGLIRRLDDPVVIADEEWGQRIAAVVVLRDGASLDHDDLQAFATRSLRGSKTPEVFHVAAALPYTDTGKLLRRQVQAELAAAAT